MKKQLVMGISPTEAEANAVVESLKTASFVTEDISVLMKQDAVKRDLNDSTILKGATRGAEGGVLAGGAIGLLAGIGLITIPALGPFIAAGPLMAAIAGAAMGGASGGLGGALLGVTMPDHQIKLYESLLKEGNVLLIVHTDSPEEVDKAEDIMKSGGVKDIHKTTQAVKAK